MIEPRRHLLLDSRSGTFIGRKPSGRTMIDIRALQPFGAELFADLSCDLDSQDQARLCDLLSRHKLLVCRDQQLTREDQNRIMGYLGPVLPAEREHRELALDGDFGSAPIAYHSDLLFTPSPYPRISLFALDVDEGLSSTRFVSGISACAALPVQLRNRLEGLHAISIVPQVQTHRAIDPDASSVMRSHRHPVLSAHPVTGETILLPTEMQTARIEGLSLADSEALLHELFGYLYQPDRVHEHVWHRGDLVIWDNHALQHGRDDQSARRVRRLRRVVGAELSFYDLCPEFVKDDPQIKDWGNGQKWTAANS